MLAYGLAAQKVGTTNLRHPAPAGPSPRYRFVPLARSVAAERLEMLEMDEGHWRVDRVCGIAGSLAAVAHDVVMAAAVGALEHLEQSTASLVDPSTASPLRQPLRVRPCPS